MGFPLLQKTGEMCVDRQIKVLGSYWKGNMTSSCEVDDTSNVAHHKEEEEFVRNK